MDAPRTMRLYLAGGAAALLTTVGCTPDEGSPGGYGDRPGETEPGEGVSATLSVAEDTQAGPVVTDADGYTLYVSTADSANPTVSTCTADCAEQWPPATAEGEVTTEGIDASLVDSYQRPEGGTQLTLAGWPLYRFSGDVDPGDVNGQGADGVWFAVGPQGTRSEVLPHPSPEGTGGYVEFPQG
ncbi:hypothetical protein LG943_08285 [Streptomonospora sp. S1-112]|uniref:Lipoprotein n=1 Tax=Streptomonospora mangrovi TaxID=2883123 RepID=A0A9X3NM38_9ACTN|nr:hypothetical protein [Streptomonospora mangrovi]MDA0564324.1 hypothetical protein [Streptomonospora mangrovi]